MFETDGSIMIFWQALGESKEGGMLCMYFSKSYVPFTNLVLSACTVSYRPPVSVQICDHEFLSKMESNLETFVSHTKLNHTHTPKL